MRAGFRVIFYLFLLALLISSLQLLRLALQKPLPQDVISHAQLAQDLQHLQRQLRRYSAFGAIYPERLGRIEQHIQQLQARYPQHITLNRFNTEVRKLISLLQDPGGSVSAPPFTTRQLPLTLQKMQQQWLALDGHHPLDSQRPFISHIDGLPMGQWLAAAQRMLWPGQPLSRQLQQLQTLRQELGLPLKDQVIITLEGPRMAPRNITLPLADNAVANALSPPAMSQWQWLDSHTQLLRLTQLDRLEIDPQLRRDVKKALGANTLILDLRQAKGSSQLLLQWLAPGRQHPATQPMGYARYHRSARLRNDFLSPLGFMPVRQFRLFPPITAALAAQPHPLLSPWFARPSPVLPPAPAAPQQRLVLLIGHDCREECEWLAHSAKQWRHTLLMGEATAGDMGRKYNVRLPASGIQLRFSASLAYDKYGNLLSGKGTSPDLPLALPPQAPWDSLLDALQQHFLAASQSRH
ncbi:S41 family peptidase [Shewanella sp. YIC-542]|uniref:S41 family peptidase n=1 Tax=Shewanella mytili TaxID=3377111 RepID=UPI00398EAB85